VVWVRDWTDTEVESESKLDKTAKDETYTEVGEATMEKTGFGIRLT